MALKNATSKSKNTMEAIQKSLATHGAKRIMFDYDNAGRVQGIAFILDVEGSDIPFKMPARIDNVAIVMYGESYINLDEKRQDQAYRTAWANIRDWIIAQMAMLDTRMATIEEIFLPYMADSMGETLYEKINRKGFNNFQLPSGKE